MKKDIGWAKKEIKELMTEESQYYPHNNMIEQEAVLGILNQLDESEVLSQEWIDGNSSYVSFEGVAEKYVHVDDLKELLVPKQELPVVPKYVANWIAKYREDSDLYPALRRLEDNTSFGGRVYEWYRANTHDFVNAYLTGEYEVEEEQKYYVKDSKGSYILAKIKGEVMTMGEILEFYGHESVDIGYNLTEQEIKGYDSRYWAFAVPVEELEE